jgi:hypothetical protein
MRLAVLLSGLLVACGGKGSLEPLGGDPPPAEAGIALLFDDGPNCTVQPHSISIGTVTDSELDELISTSGDDQINCSVQGDGPFTISADFDVDGTRVELSIPAFAKTQSPLSPAPASISVQSASTLQTYIGASCNAWIEGAGQEVARGRAWFQLSCDSVDGADGAQVCSIGVSSLAMQNCEQEAQ